LIEIRNLLDFKLKIGEDIYNNYVTALAELKVENNFYCCKYCFLSLSKQKCLSIAVSNNLYLDPIPPELQITELENQQIAKSLLFMKLTRLPKSRLLKISDKVINVPLEDEDLEKTITSLPRGISDSHVQFIRLKRKQSYKNSHVMEFIRPNVLRKAILFLKQIENPSYTDVSLNENDI
jgi:hypothetical protein